MQHAVYVTSSHVPHAGIRRGPYGQEKRGFAVMSKEQNRAIAFLGGISSHKLGNAHKWTSESARQAVHTRWLKKKSLEHTSTERKNDIYGNHSF